MQAKKETFSDFLKRTDELALVLKKNVQDLTDTLDMSRASLFSYRTGKRPITSKAWRKLEQAERAAGLAPPFEEQLKEASGKEAMRLLESATRTELFSLMPPEVRQKLMEGDLEGLNNRMIAFINDAVGLATTAKDYLARPRSKEAREEVEYFIGTVQRDAVAARRLWDEIYKSLRARFLE